MNVNEAMEIELKKENRDYFELQLDYNFVTGLNTELARKYQELMDSFPLSKELDVAIKSVEDNIFNYSPEDKEKRLNSLKKFRTALIALEKQDINILPPKYDELDE